MDEEDNERGIAHFIEHMTFDSSKKYPARGGVWDAITSFGAGDFNAFTTFRTTTFQLYDMPVNNLLNGLALHRSQVAEMTPSQAFVTAEVGAILGEARFRNETDRLQTNAILANHGGPTWRIPQRFTIGLPEQISNFSAAGMLRFYNKWYRPERFTAIVVGNATAKDLVAAVTATFKDITAAPGQPASPPAHPADGAITVVKNLVLQQLRGVNGIEFHLMCTRPYTRPSAMDAAYFRTVHLNRVLATAYALLVHVRLAEMYPEEILADFNGRDASIKVKNEYQLNIEAHVWAVTIPGDPQTGTWRRDFEIALTELRRLAVHGVHGQLLASLMQIVANNLDEGQSRSGWEDSKKLADKILGSGDPEEVYVSPAEEARLGLEFLTGAHLESAQAYIQAEAQFLYMALVDIAGAVERTTGRDPPPFPGVAPAQASLYVFVGNSTVTREVDQLVPEDIKKAIYQVEQSIPPPNILIDHFMLVLSRGLKIGGVEIPGTAPPIGIPKSGSLFNRRRVFSNVVWPQNIAWQSNAEMGIQSFRLFNGVRINVKLANSGNASQPDSEPGRAVMHVVSLGGKATESQGTLQVCQPGARVRVQRDLLRRDGQVRHDRL